MWISLSTDIKILEMKSMRNEIRFAYMTAALLLAACTADESEPKSEGAVVSPRLEFGVCDMTMSAVSRAVEPMSPDLEKYVKTMAVFEFDNEGLHEKGEFTYHFIDFIAGTVDGAKNVGSVKPTEFGIVESSLDGLKFEYRSKGTICLVANVSEGQVDTLYNDHRDPGQSYGRLRLARFKEWALPFDYEQPQSEVYDESVTGHIRNMYMFGYYQGPIEPTKAEAIRIDLGRLASRVDITIVNKTEGDITERLGYHFDNVCLSAFFFPMKQGMPPSSHHSLMRTVICSGPDPVEGDENHEIVLETFPRDSVHTRYFYVAAHSAQGYEDATKLHLFYDRLILDDSDFDDDTNSFEVPLCNVHPLQAANVPNGYSLSRNTRYHFTIRLKQRDASAAPSRAAQGQSVEYGDRPGEITVYLP